MRMQRGHVDSAVISSDISFAVQSFARLSGAFVHKRAFVSESSGKAAAQNP